MNLKSPIVLFAWTLVFSLASSLLVSSFGKLFPYGGHQDFSLNLISLATSLRKVPLHQLFWGKSQDWLSLGQLCHLHLSHAQSLNLSVGLWPPEEGIWALHESHGQGMEEDCIPKGNWGSVNIIKGDQRLRQSLSPMILPSHKPLFSLSFPLFLSFQLSLPTLSPALSVLCFCLELSSFISVPPPFPFPPAFQLVSSYLFSQICIIKA